jgi:hypothetical protein
MLREADAAQMQAHLRELRLLYVLLGLLLKSPAEIARWNFLLLAGVKHAIGN